MADSLNSCFNRLSNLHTDRYDRYPSKLKGIFSVKRNSVLVLSVLRKTLVCHYCELPVVLHVEALARHEKSGELNGSNTRVHRGLT